MTQRKTLKKHERLKSKILLEKLFSEGESVFNYPFKLLYFVSTPDVKYSNQTWPLLFSVSVPKKKIKSAPLRNLVKRRTREAYRLHKSPLQSKLLSEKNVIVSLMFIYIRHEPLDYAVIEKAVIKLLSKLDHEIS